MNKLERRMLLCALYTPRRKEDILKRAARLRVRRPHRHALDHAFDNLEDQYMIEELGKKELEAFYRGEESDVSDDPPSGFYLATDYGVDAGEELLSDSRRFWVPIVVSTLISAASLVASILIALG